MSENPIITDQGLGAWLRANIRDPRVQLPLFVTLALILIANLAIRLFGGVGAALEAAAFELLLFYTALLIVTASVAVFPVGDQRTPDKAEAAKRVQKNARGNFLLLLFVGALCASIAYFMIIPVWSTVVFNIQYQRFRFGMTTLEALLEPSLYSSSNELTLDVDERQLPILNDLVADPQVLIRLVGRQATARIPPDLDITKFQHTAVIAANDLTFDETSSIKIGNSNLVIIAFNLHVINAHSLGPKIFAYDVEDVPSNDGLGHGKQGRDGLPAGNLTIVLLGNYFDDGNLILDLRGQRGGPGARGLQPPPRPPADNLDQSPGRPKWSFRNPNPSEIKKYQKEFARLLSDADVPEQTKQELRNNDLKFQRCISTGVGCVRPSCDDPDWPQLAKGQDGEPGANGETGGQGGRAGDSGLLRVFYRGGDNHLLDALRMHLVWANGSPITTAPPRRERSAGGPGGEAGLGGAGGLGRPADPFGACENGKPGKRGASGGAGSPGSQGEQELHPGRLTQPQELIGFPAVTHKE